MVKKGIDGEGARKKNISPVSLWAAVGAMSVGCVMLVVSLLLPPPGEIDGSVLVAFGEILTFSGAVFGIGKLRGKTPGMS